MGGTLLTIAKDVKLQVEFNPAKVQAYRLIGYENRTLNNEDFNDDTKDAGELGAGHTVTALYEIVPHGVNVTLPGVDSLKYQGRISPAAAASSNELLTVKFRYKEPKGTSNELIEAILHDNIGKEQSNNFQFAAAVAGFGMLLRQSEFKGDITYRTVLRMARDSKGEDRLGYRAELIRMIEQAELLAGGKS
jgi:Ca-activated chloride channel family protein